MSILTLKAPFSKKSIQRNHLYYYLSEEGNQQYYDREKYVELALDVAETILGVFGFDRRQLGVRRKPKDYIEELKFIIGFPLLSVAIFWFA